jgi:putative ABC transport system permease protein
MRLSLFRTLSLRYLKLRWSRAAMVVASITLGVATLVATRALNQSMQAASQVSARPLGGMADLVVSNGDVGVNLDLAPELSQVDGVRAVMPLLIERVYLPDLDRPAVLIGADISFKSVRENPWGIKYNITNVFQAWKSGERAVLVGKQLAADLSARLPKGSDTFRVRAQGETLNLPLWAGTVDAQGPAAALGTSVLYMRADVAGGLLGKPHMVSRLDVTIDPAANADQVRRRIDETLAGRANVRTPQEFDQIHHDPMQGLQIGFTFCGAGALVVGLFLVYNVLSVSVTERRHEIGILRSLGATKGQVCGLFLGEAALLGLIGALLGLPLGIYLAHLGLGPMQRVFSDLFTVDSKQDVVLGSSTLALAASAGMLAALIAALVPAWKASKEQPANAVRRNPPPSDLAHLILHVASGIVLLVLAAICMALRAHLPKRAGNHGFLAFSIIGMLLLTPLVATLLAKLFQPLIRRTLGLEFRLAADNLVRAPGRTGLVITALAAGVGMLLSTAGFIRSNEDVVLGWIDRAILADLFVTSGSPVGGSNLNLPLKDSLGDEIARVDPAIDNVLAARFRQLDYDSKQIYLVARDAKVYYETAQRAKKRAPGLALFPKLTEPGTPKVIVSENFADLYHVKVGDTISLPGPRGPVPLEVIGTAEDYSWNQGSVIMDRGIYKELFQDNLVDVFELFLKPDANPEPVREALSRRWGVEHGLVILKRAELFDHVQDIIHRLYQIAYSQEVVVGLVAALGVVTALLISVIQRRHEIGVLRALGATRAQVLLSVLAEAALMGVIGTIIGMLVGVPIEWYILQVILFEEAGFRFAVSIPWAEAAVIAFLALVIATLAGLIPALHTLRMRIPEAIAYE